MNFDRFLFTSLCAYFFFLSGWAKEFSYLNVQLGPLPVYIGEGALGAALLYSMRELKAQWERFSRFFLGAFVLYLAWGFVRLVVSAFDKPPETQWIQLIKNFAMVYQSLWILFGLTLAQSKARQWLKVCMAGLCLEMAFHAFKYFYLGLAKDYSIAGFFGFVYGNELLNSAFPYVTLLFSSVPAFLMTIPFGLTLMGMFLVYFKKTWIFETFFIALPIFLIALFREELSLRDRLRKGARLAAALLLGLGISLSLNVIIVRNVERAAAEREKKHYVETGFDDTLMSMIRGQVKNVRVLIFHGELRSEDESIYGENHGKQTEQVSYMAWRMFFWRQTWKKFWDHPIVGNGFAKLFADRQFNGEPPVFADKLISGPHNSHLHLAFRAGLIGLSLFVGMVGFALLRALTARASQELLLFVGLLGMHLFFSFFNVGLENPHYGNYFWVFLGAVVRLGMDAREKARSTA